jgi:hypothetical protein
MLSYILICFLTCFLETIIGFCLKTTLLIIKKNSYVKKRDELTRKLN